jgi:uncharacterized protein
VHRVEPWFRNQLKRLVKTPKLHFIDSGLLAVTAGATEERVTKDRSILGPLLETYLFSEVMNRCPGLTKPVGSTAEIVGSFWAKLQAGLVLYDSENTVPFGDNLFAAPISCVWG